MWNQIFTSQNVSGNVKPPVDRIEALVRASTLAVKLLLESLAFKIVTEGKTETTEELCES